jgi:hypothetical protein
MSIVISLLISHLLSMIEAALIAEEPTIVAEMQLLITKLEGYISGKSTTIAADINPVLNNISAIVPTVVNTTISAVQSNISDSATM